MANFTNEYIEVVRRNTGDPPGITEEIYEQCVTQAVRIYSKFKPQIIVTDIPGADPAIFDLTLPNTYVDQFSSIDLVEFPYLAINQNPIMLKPSQFRIYRSPSGFKLRLIENTAGPLDVARVTFTSPHSVTISSSTIPSQDEDAIGNMATSLLAEIVAADFSNISRSTLDEISIDFRTKAQEWQILADRYKMLFRKDLGLAEDKDIGPAVAWTDLDMTFTTGVDFLTHPKRWR